MPNIGDSIDRYVIEAVLGEGGMGRVYRALDPRLGRRVALKVLLADGASESVRVEAAARMMREARAVAAFGHANVVAIHDVGEVDGSPYIAMELVSGSTLRAYVGDAQTAHEHKLAWLLDVARGLGAAHRAGLVHRDIKPENVMVTAEGVVKILDFGIARRVETAEAVDSGAPTAAAHLSSLTAEGMMIGTPQYMPPEQLQGEPLDGRADQFAWGVMAWELFAGVLPWGASKNGAQLVAAVLATPVRPLRDVVPGVDPIVSDAVARAVSKSREARFATMDELLAALDDKRPAGRASASAPRSQEKDIAFETTTAQPSVRGALLVPATHPSAMPPALAAAPLSTGGASAVVRSASDLTRSRETGRVPIVVGALAAIALAMGIAIGLRHEAKAPSSAGQPSPTSSARPPTSASVAAQPPPGGSVAPAAAPLVGACKDGVKSDCGAGSKAWCDVHDQPIACCGAGLVPTGDDGVCGCPPGGALADAGASGCPTAKGDGVGNADAVVQAIRPHLRACYDSAGNESLAGSMTVVLEVAPDGRVYRARIKEGRLASPVVQKCTLDELRKTVFEPPQGGDSTLQIPIRFAVDR